MPNDIDKPDSERSRRDALTRGSPPEAYYGFDFRSVTWGYRELFKSKIDNLFAEGLLGDLNEQVTQVFFDLIREADRAHFDHVVRAFLSSLTPTNKWIMTIPALFEEWCRIGFDLAARHLYMGERYFHAWRRETLGRTPAETAAILGIVRRLAGIDPEFAYHFLKGCESLVGEIPMAEIQAFVEEAVAVYGRNRAAGLKFVSLDLKSSKEYLREITRESRLDDLKPRLERIVCALAGRQVAIRPLSELGVNALAPRPSRLVCACDALYLPERLREAASQEGNRGLHLLAAAMAAACHAFGSFAAVQGAEGFANSTALVEREGIRPACAADVLFRLFEIRRVVASVRSAFPGLRRLLDFGVETEFGARPVASWTDALLAACLSDSKAPAGGGELRTGNGGSQSDPLDEAFELADRIASGSRQFYDTLFRLSEALPRLLELARLGGAGEREPPEDPFADPALALRPLGFFPDFAFPLRLVSPAPSAAAVDLRADSIRRRQDAAQRAEAIETTADRDVSGESLDRDSALKVRGAGTGDGLPREKISPAEGPPVGFFYDEWNGLEQDYYENWCCLREIRPRAVPYPLEKMRDLEGRARRVRAVFEQIRPDEARREKRLPEGDEIDIDAAVEFAAMRRARQSPKADFYIRPRIRRRSLATALVIDLSGSTADACSRGAKQEGRTGPRVIEQEKEAAFILAEGLDSLGDQFGLFGFTGSGRERCEFAVFKDFDEKWDSEAVGRLHSARPGSSTRMGVALRHAGWKLQKTPALRKLVILISDGKPMDSGYDPASRYAQYDVRKACEENLRQGIDAFCISTLENTRADLELMFPRKRFIVIEDMQRLPAMLSRFYLKLTKA